MMIRSISRLLTEDPDQRLGAGGASEVWICSFWILISIFFYHFFFINVKWLLRNLLSRWSGTYFSRISTGIHLPGRRFEIRYWRIIKIAYPCFDRLHDFNFLIQAAFVPMSDGPLDTSYFTSRISWTTLDEHVYPPSELDDSSDADSLSGSNSGMSTGHDEVVF